MQDLILLLMFVTFLTVGVLAPFVMSLGYVWVDVFEPHQISASLLANQPIAMVMGGAALVAYVLGDRRLPPRLNMTTMLMALMGLWVTCTLQWAVAPATALYRWDLCIKTCLFATFLPFVIRSRIQIEAFVLVYMFSIMGHLMAWGAKTVLTGGGYNQSLGLLSVNSSLLAESSAVSAVAVMMTAFLLSVRKWSKILPHGRLMDIGYWSMVALSLIAAVGTFARTAIVAFAVTGGAMLLRSKRKMLFILTSVILTGVVLSVTSDRWFDRISTVADYQSENSAYVRILVWEWTMRFVQTHPFGGGFWASVTSQIVIPPVGDEEPTIQFGRAYHNVFFALLGDHGYPGLALYLGLIGSCLLSLQNTRRRMLKLEEHVWAADLAQTIQVAILTLMASGMFVEIGWHPIVWYLFSMSVSLQQYARRVTEANSPAIQDRHRMMAGQAIAGPAGAAAYPRGAGSASAGS